MDAKAVFIAVAGALAVACGSLACNRNVTAPTPARNQSAAEQPAQAEPQPMKPSSSETPIDPAFAALYGSWFTVVASQEQELADSWPAARYRILLLRPEKTGAVGIRHAFERRRPDGEVERVEREFHIHVVEDGENLPLVVHHPYHIPVRRGDRVEIPVPLDDPWGELAGFEWQTPASGSLYGPYEPADHNCAWTGPPPEAEMHSPHLELQTVHCQKILLRSLRSRMTSWGLFVARKTGRLTTEPIEVVRERDRVIPAMVRHERVISGGGSTSSMTAVDSRAVIPMTLGDTVWMPLAIQVIDR